MIEIAANAGNMGAVRNATWALSNMVRGKPQPQLNVVSAALPTVVRLLGLNDDEVTSDASWALSYVSDGANEAIEAVVASGCIPLLMGILERGSASKLHTPALRALCNIVTGSAEATQAVLDAGFLNVLPSSLRSAKMQTRKEAMWALSNITAGTEAQLDAVLSSPLAALAIERLDCDDFDVKKEAAWVCANAFHAFKHAPSYGSAQRVASLVQHGCIKPLVALLDANDVALQKLVLEALANLLAAGDEMATHAEKWSKGGNPFLAPFEEAEGIDKLEALQEHSNEAVYSAAIGLLEKYFVEDGDDEDENLAPNAEGNAFVFNSAAPFGASNLGAQPAFAF